MKKCYCLVFLLLLFTALAIAQTWSNDVIVRKAYPVIGIRKWFTIAWETALLCGARDTKSFTSALTLSATLPAKAQTEVSIYNIRGQKVKTLTSGIMDKGTSTLSWDGKDDKGSSTASGIYFVRLNSGKHTQVKKVIRY